MKRVVVVGSLIAAAAVVAVLLWPGHRAPPTPGRTPVPEPESLDAWFGPEPASDAPATKPARPNEPDGGRTARREPGSFPARAPWTRGVRRGGGDAGAGRSNRRRSWRQRLARRVEIVPLGPSDPGLSPEDALSALRAARREVHECAREAGIDRAQWREARSTARTLQFDVGPDGHVTAGSVSIEPALPEGMQRCFAQSLEKASTEVSPGPDGARVSFEMPARGPRRRFGGGDAGAGPRRLR